MTRLLQEVARAGPGGAARPPCARPNIINYQLSGGDDRTGLSRDPVVRPVDRARRRRDRAHAWIRPGVRAGAGPRGCGLALASGGGHPNSPKPLRKVRAASLSCALARPIVCLVDLARRRRDWAHPGGWLARRPPQPHSSQSTPTPASSPAQPFARACFRAAACAPLPLPCSLTSLTRVIPEPTRFPPSLGLDCVPHTGLQPPDISTHTLFTRAPAFGPRPHNSRSSHDSRSSHTLPLTLPTHT